jgi:Retrotransposon gag protein
MALTYIKGERVNDWQEEQLNKLESTTHQHTDEAIWQEFEQAFKDAFTNSNKKQRAYEKLKNHQMTGDDVDSYISGFENLVKQAGWSRNDAGTMDLFQASLRHELKKAILNQETWPTTLNQWESDARKQNSRHKARTALLGQRPRQPSRPSVTQEQLRQGMGLPPRPPQPRRDPYAMDVDNTQVEANTATRAQREKFRREGRCIGCGQFGHFVRNCPKGQPSKRIPQSSSRTQQPNQSSGSRPLPAPPHQRQNNWRQPPPPPYSSRLHLGQNGSDRTGQEAPLTDPLIDLMDHASSSEDPAPTVDPGASREVARHLRGMNQEEQERVWDELQREEGEDFP